MKMKSTAGLKLLSLSSKRKTFCALCIVVSVGIIFLSCIHHGTTIHEEYRKIASAIGRYKRSVEARACVIPKTPIMPKFYKNIWRPRSLHGMCSYEKRLTKVEDDQKLMPLPDVNQSSCVMEVIRGENDHKYHLSKCLPLKSIHYLHNQESIIIKSGTFFNAELNIPLVPLVVEKLRHWESKHQNELPISVLLFGVDTTSRAHAYRSLPRSLDVLKRMKFIDFESFHSVRPATLTNFKAFLMGLREDTVRRTCSPNWSAPFDTCPMIWKNFSHANYVTMYIEDGSQTFNWGGQSGFIQRPTDYYWHHLFLQLRDIRRQQFKAQNLSDYFSIDCASTESMGEFLLRSTKRFLDKFSNIPFFEFMWIEDPFHDDRLSLAGLDQYMTDFLEYLESKPELLRRTLIIFLSDHGDRTSSFQATLESFIERGSVPLFVRMPEALIERYPDAYTNLKENAYKLATPFDVHHTLLHVLQEDFWADVPLPLNVHPSDVRSSLFHPIDPKRTCEGTSIIKMFCLCNIKYEPNASHGKTILELDHKLRRNVLEYAVRKLNTIVMHSAYSSICKTWETLKTDQIIYMRPLGQSKDHVEFAMSFSVLDRAARFNTRLKLDLNMITRIENVDEALDFMGIERNNGYRNQSWCVDTKTDEAKRMKNFCFCKEVKPKTIIQDHSRIEYLDI